MYVVNPSRLVPTWRQVDEGAGGAAEEDEVYADGVDQVEDVDHAVALLDEEHQVAQDEQDQPDRAELGAIDKPDKNNYDKYFCGNNNYFWSPPALGWDGQHGDDEEPEQEPDEPPAEHHQREGDGRHVDQVEVHGLAVIAMREPPHRSEHKYF